MLQALPAAASRLVASALASQWSGGVSRLGREAMESCDENTPAALAEAAAGLARMRMLLEPVEVVLAGPPNVGKSTLTNALVSRPVSLVHDQPGTTRDWVRELAILDGVPIQLTDTAGLWKSDHPIDAESVRRAWQRIESAELVLLLREETPIELPADVRAKATLRVATKADLPHPVPPDRAEISISARTGEGLDRLRRAILQTLGLEAFDPSEPMAFTERQALLLQRAAGALERHNPQAARERLRQLLEGEPPAG
jgi:tRNA modification GTPase